MQTFYAMKVAFMDYISFFVTNFPPYTHSLIFSENPLIEHKEEQEAAADIEKDLREVFISLSGPFNFFAIKIYCEI